MPSGAAPSGLPQSGQPRMHGCGGLGGAPGGGGGEGKGGGGEGMGGGGGMYILHPLMRKRTMELSHP